MSCWVQFSQRQAVLFYVFDFHGIYQALPFQQFLFFIKISVCVLHEILYTLHVQVPMEARGSWIHGNWSYRQL